MRQVGSFAAAADYALDHNLQRLADDHGSARELGRLLAQSPRIRIDAEAIQTNVLVFDLVGTTAEGAPSSSVPDAPALVAKARSRGVLVNALSPTRLRALTHLDAPLPACRRAGEILLEILATER
jgi:threonine aldolase